MRKAVIIFLCKLKQNRLHRDRTDLEETIDTKPKAKAWNSETENQKSRSGYPESGEKFKKKMFMGKSASLVDNCSHDTCISSWQIK